MKIIPCASNGFKLCNLSHIQLAQIKNVETTKDGHE